MKDRIQYGYDRAGNRTWRKNLVAPENQDQHYLYDPLYQVAAGARGNLNLNQTAIGGIPAQQQTFTYDPTGNWERNTTAENGVEVLDQTRIHNQANQITQIDDSNTGLLYDRAGNATQMPPNAAGDWNQHYKLIWDAWNRLVKVEDQDEEAVASYAYDGATRRTTKAAGGEVTHTFYNDRWKAVEERLDNSEDAHLQYLWGARPSHRDELVRRDRDTDDSGSLEEKLYCLMDYFDPISLTDEDGTVQERYQFSAFGARTVTAADWDPRPGSEFNLDFGFHGQLRDDETAYYQYGHRSYSPEVGRWLSRDPIREEGGMNLYLFANNSGCNDLDYLGLTALTAEDTFKVVNVPPQPGALGEAWASQWYLILDAKVSTCPEGFMALDIASASATISTFDSGNKGTRVHESAHIRDWKDVWTSIFGIVRSFANGGCLCAETAICLKTEGIVDDLLSLGKSIVKVRGALLHAIGGYSPDGQWIAPNHPDQRQAFLDLYYKGVNQNTKDMNQIVKKISDCYKAGSKK